MGSYSKSKGGKKRHSDTIAPTQKKPAKPVVTNTNNVKKPVPSTPIKW